MVPHSDGGRSRQGTRAAQGWDAEKAPRWQLGGISVNPFPVNRVTVKRAKHGRQNNLRRNWIVTQPQVGWVRNPLAGWSVIRGRRIFVCRTWRAAQDVADAITSGANPGDLVLSPFGGIGSEGHVALLKGRQFVGIELKGSYFAAAVGNLKVAESEALLVRDLFASVDGDS